MLNDKRNRQCAFHFRRIDSAKQINKRRCSKAISNRRPSHLAVTKTARRAIDRDRTKVVDACFSDLRGGSRADVDIYIFEVAGFRRVRTATLKVHGKSGNHAVNPFPCRRSDLNGLRGIEFVKNWRQTTLRKALHSQVAVVGDSANNEPRLVDGRNNKAIWRPGADRYNYVAEVVRPGVAR